MMVQLPMRHNGFCCCNMMLSRCLATLLSDDTRHHFCTCAGSADCKSTRHSLTTKKFQLCDAFVQRKTETEDHQETFAFLSQQSQAGMTVVESLKIRSVSHLQASRHTKCTVLFASSDSVQRKRVNETTITSALLDELTLCDEPPFYCKATWFKADLVTRRQIDTHYSLGCLALRGEIERATPLHQISALTRTGKNKASVCSWEEDNHTFSVSSTFQPIIM